MNVKSIIYSLRSYSYVYERICMKYFAQVIYFYMRILYAYKNILLEQNISYMGIHAYIRTYISKYV